VIERIPSPLQVTLMPGDVQYIIKSTGPIGIRYYTS
jgi:hypothetical protein